jgi:hypothetical protein
MEKARNNAAPALPLCRGCQIGAVVMRVPPPLRVVTASISIAVDLRLYPSTRVALVDGDLGGGALCCGG